MQTHTTLFQRQKNTYSPENSLENRVICNAPSPAPSENEAVEDPTKNLSLTEKRQVYDEWKAAHPESSILSGVSNSREKRYEKERKEEQNNSPILSIIPEMRRQLAERFTSEDKDGSVNWLGTGGKLALNAVIYPYALWNIGRTIQKGIVNNVAEEVFPRRIFPAVGQLWNRGVTPIGSAGLNTGIHALHGTKEGVSGIVRGINWGVKRILQIPTKGAKWVTGAASLTGIPGTGAVYDWTKGIDESLGKSAEISGKNSWEKAKMMGYDVSQMAGNLKQVPFSGLDATARGITSVGGPMIDKSVGQNISSVVQRVRDSTVLKDIFFQLPDDWKKNNVTDNKYFKPNYQGWKPKTA